MNMSPKEKDICRFLDFCVSEGLSERRISKYRGLLQNLSKWLKTGFREATKDDIQELVVRINKTSYSDWTKYNYKVAIKKFYKWLEGDNEEFPKKVRWIKNVKVKNKKIADDLLTQEDVKRMIEKASNIRDKAIISVLYESGCRIGELLSLKIKSVQNKNSDLVHIHVSGKTGNRPIPLVTSIPYLSTWINNHPNRDNPESNLFISIGTRNNNGPVGYHTIIKMLSNLGKRSEIKKKVNPHNFRHSRASYLANKLKEPQMRMFFGWSKGSDMPETYVHLSGRDIDDAILEVNGIKNPEPDKSEKTLNSKTCPRCDNTVEATLEFCSKCMLPMDEKSLLNHERKMNEFMEILNRRDVLEKLIDARIDSMLEKVGLSV